MDQDEKVSLDFETISRALRQTVLPQVDMIVGIAEGGIMPASLLAHQLALPLCLIRINYRAIDNTPQRPNPELLSTLPDLPGRARILLVDDVSVSGKTLALARELLREHEIITFTLKGRADFVVFPEIAACVNWPWKIASD
jgi:adenine/guanine phosphoribosyltransferase-like PRPP-binding protein